MRPYKVAFISHSYVESALRRKFAYLSELVDLRLITPDRYPMPYGWYPLESDFHPGVLVQSHPIHFLHYKRTSTRWFLGTRDMNFLKFQPDIIHLENDLHSWIGCQTLLYRKMFAPQAKVVIFTWENLTLQEQGARARALELLTRFNRRFADFYICGSNRAREIIVDKGVSPDVISVFPQYGIDSDTFYPYSAEQREACRREIGISSGQFAIGYVGRFVEEKGLLDLVEATAQLHATSQRPVVLVLTGKGNLEGTLVRRSAELGIRLIVQPARKYHGIAPIMNALDVLVLPSRSTPFWKEQYGKVLTEAMACRTPVLGSDSGAIPEIIGDAGLVFHEGDRENLFQALKLCCQNEEFRLLLGQKCLNRVLAHYTNKKIAEQTLEVYDLVVKCAQAGNPVPRAHKF